MCRQYRGRGGGKIENFMKIEKCQNKSNMGLIFWVTYIKYSKSFPITWNIFQFSDEKDVGAIFTKVTYLIDQRGEIQTPEGAENTTVWLDFAERHWGLN